MKSGKPRTGTADSSCETVLLLGICEGLVLGLAQETSKRRLPRVAVKGVGSLLEFDAVEQTLDVARDRIRSHDKRGIKRMNVLACDRALRVTNKGRDRDLGEPEVVRDACEAVPQYSGVISASDVLQNIFSQ
jgi:hypothetical protein